MIESTKRFLVLTLCILSLVACDSSGDPMNGRDVTAAGSPADGSLHENTSELSQEEINRRLIAERRSDPLLQFEPLYDPEYVRASEATHLQPDDRLSTLSVDFTLGLRL